MTLIEEYAKNGYELKSEWQLKEFSNVEKIETLLNIAKEHKFYYDIDLLEFQREESIKYPRIQQVLNDIERVLLPYIINDNNAIIYKDIDNKDTYVLDDNFAYIVFKYDKINQKFKVYDIITSMIFSITDKN